MNRDQIEALWQQAKDRGLLPAQAHLPHDDQARPWPVVLLTALGAWLAAVPLMIVLGLAFGPLFEHGGAYLAGVLLLAAAVVILRSSGLALFVEQLAVPLLLTGGACLGFAWFKDLPEPVPPVLLALLALAFGWLVRPHGLKACLGAAAAFFTAMAFWPVVWNGRHSGSTESYWLSWHVCAGLWLLACWWARSAGGRSASRA